MHRVRRQQPVDHGGPGTWQAGDEDRPLDRHVDVLRILLERGFRHQTCHQRVPGEEALHLAAELGQISVAASVVFFLLDLDNTRRSPDIPFVPPAQLVRRHDGSVALEFSLPVR